MGEETQAVHTVARQADAVAVKPGRFQLAELSADDFITRAVVALDVYASYVGSARRLRLNHDGHAGVVAVDVWHAFDARKSKTKPAKVVRKRTDGFGHILGVVGLTGSNADQRFEIVFSAQKVPFQPYTRHHKTLALGDVHRDGHVLLAGGDGHLGRVNGKLQKTTRQIEGTEGFQIGIEPSTGVTIGPGVPAQPVAGVQVEQAT